MVKAYYNEIDPYAAEWLKALMRAGHIASGDIDTRDIRDVRPSELAGYTQCHFFAGIGGWPCALRLAEWPDDRPIWTGSCPCQPFSVAGKRKGFADERHLWPDWLRLIHERRPAIIVGEQVASAPAWLAGVRGDLEALDYAVGAIPYEAACVGAPHKRDRYRFVAVGDSGRAGLALRSIQKEQRGDLRQQGAAAPATSPRGDLADPDRSGRETRLGDVAPSGYGNPSTASDCDFRMADTNQLGAGEEREQRGWQLGGLSGNPGGRDFWGNAEWFVGADGKARRVKPGIRLLAHGVPARVGKLRALGNAVVPPVEAAFIRAAVAAIGDLVTW